MADRPKILGVKCVQKKDPVALKYAAETYIGFVGLYEWEPETWTAGWMPKGAPYTLELCSGDDPYSVADHASAILEDIIEVMGNVK